MQPLNRSAFLSDNGMTPALTQAPPAKSARIRIKATWKPALVFCAAIVFFGLGIDTRYFDDEYAYITQSYYADLFFGGKFNDKLWLEPEAVDLQPLPKYLIGLAFRVAGLPMPVPVDARNWYFPLLRRNRSPVWGGKATLIAARLTVIPLGALGCLALFGSGVLVKNAGGGTGCRAAHDQPAVRVARSSCDVRRAVRGVHARGAGGLAVHVGGNLVKALDRCQLAASLACGDPGWPVDLVQAQWLPGAGNHRGMLRALVAVCRGFRLRKLAVTGATIVTVAAALVVAVVLNPYFTAKPAEPTMKGLAAELRTKNVWERFRYQVSFRLETSKHQKTAFAINALDALGEKVKVILVQGFGRFGPFGPRAADSTLRYDPREDWGAVFWLPIVCYGLYEAIRLGRSQLAAGRPPVARGARRLGCVCLGGGDALLADGLGPLSASDPERQRALGGRGHVRSLGSTRGGPRVAERSGGGYLSGRSCEIRRRGSS